MRKILVTGASGSLGRAVIKKFLDEGDYVIGTVIPGDTIPLDIENTRFEKATVDLLNGEDAAGFITSVIEKHATIDVAVLTVVGLQWARSKKQRRLRLPDRSVSILKQPIILPDLYLLKW